MGVQEFHSTGQGNGVWICSAILTKKDPNNNETIIDSISGRGKTEDEAMINLLDVIKAEGILLSREFLQKRGYI